MVTFAALRKANLLGTVLNTGLGAEEVSYFPSGGVVRTITVLIHASTAADIDGGQELLEEERIDVTVARDESATTGGVARPGKGDGLLLAGEDTADLWSFEHVVKQRADSWLLRFRRRTRRQIGTAQMMKG